MELFTELGVRGTQMPDALDACKRHRYTADDLADWRALWEQAKQRTKLDDRRERIRHAPSFVRGEMLAARNPADRGIAWYKPERVAVTPRQEALRAVLRRQGESVEYKGKTWLVEPQGLRGGDGVWPWSRIETDDLQAMVGTAGSKTQ
jgi:hypothetical protein